MVGESVPEIEHAPFAGQKETRTVDNVSLAREKWREHAGIFGRIVFEVRILNDAVVSRSSPQCGADRRSFSLITRMPDQPYADAAIGRRELLDDFGRSIARTIVYHDQFTVESFGKGRGHN